MCNYLALLAEREQSRAEHRERQPPGGLLFTLFCVRHEVVPQQIDKALFEESGEGNISQPVSEVAAEAGTFFSTEFSWHAASHTFSPRTARKIKVVLISSNIKRRRHYHGIPLLYCLIERKKKRRISFDPTQKPCLFLILNSKPMHKEKEPKLVATPLSNHT